MRLGSGGHYLRLYESRLLSRDAMPQGLTGRPPASPPGRGAAGSPPGPTSPPQRPGLPAGWKHIYDPEGRMFYYNSLTARLFWWWTTFTDSPVQAALQASAILKVYPQPCRAFSRSGCTC